MKNWKDRLLEEAFIYQGKEVGVIETIAFDYNKLLDFISEELDKAREEGYEKGIEDSIKIAKTLGISVLESELSKLKANE